MHANVALALHRRRRKDKAEACYRDAVAATQSREPRALNNLGVLRAQSGDEAEARRCFELATKLDAGYQEANANLVRLRNWRNGGNNAGAGGGKLVLDERAGAAAAFEMQPAADSGGGSGVDAGTGAEPVQPLRYAAGQHLRLLLPDASGVPSCELAEVVADAEQDGRVQLRRLAVCVSNSNGAHGDSGDTDVSRDAISNSEMATLTESELVAHCARDVPLAIAALTPADAVRIDVGSFVRAYESEFDGTDPQLPWVEATIASVAFGLHMRVSPTATYRYRVSVESSGGHAGGAT